MLVVDGCGMDLCFDTVNQLSYALHGREDKKAPACAGSNITSPDNFRAGYSLTKRDLYRRRRPAGQENQENFSC